MAEKPSEPITTTQFAKPDRAVEVGGAPSTAQDTTGRNTDNDQTVTVRALRTFHQEANMQGKMTTPGEEFECSRDRAAQLRANGLIEYVEQSHGAEIHGTETDKKITERVAREQEQGRIAEKDKSAPLRNPELKLADVDPKSDPRADKSKK